MIAAVDYLADVGVDVRRRRRRRAARASACSPAMTRDPGVRDGPVPAARRRARGDPRPAPVRDHRPRPVRRPDADRGAHASRASRRGPSPRPSATRGSRVWDGDFYATGLIERLGLADAGGVVRIGLTHYNTAAEVDRLVDALGGSPRGACRRGRRRPSARLRRAARAAARSAATRRRRGHRRRDRRDGDRGVPRRGRAARPAVRARRRSRRAPPAGTRGSSSTRSTRSLAELYRAIARRVPRARGPATAAFALPAEPAGLLVRRPATGAGPADGRDWAAAWPATPAGGRSTARRCVRLEPALAPDLVACRLAIGYPVAPAAATQAFAALAERARRRDRRSAERGPAGRATGRASASTSTGGSSRPARSSSPPGRGRRRSSTRPASGARSGRLGRRRRDRARRRAAPRARGDRHRRSSPTRAGAAGGRAARADDARRVQPRPGRRLERASARRSCPTSRIRRAWLAALRRVGAATCPAIADAPAPRAPALRPSGERATAGRSSARCPGSAGCASPRATARGASRPGPGRPGCVADADPRPRRRDPGALPALVRRPARCGSASAPGFGVEQEERQLRPALAGRAPAARPGSARRRRDRSRDSEIDRLDSRARPRPSSRASAMPRRATPAGAIRPVDPGRRDVAAHRAQPTPRDGRWEPASRRRILGR